MPCGAWVSHQASAHGSRRAAPPDSFKMPRTETKATANAGHTPKISQQHSFRFRLLSVFGICTTCTQTLFGDFDGPAMFVSALKSGPAGANSFRFSCNEKRESETLGSVSLNILLQLVTKLPLRWFVRVRSVVTWMPWLNSTRQSMPA